MSSDQTRTYDRATCVVFLKTNEAFGGLSNMAGGYPLIVNGVRILTSEALYQVCRFPLLPEVQRLIIEQKSPMSAKMKSKPHRKDSRPDWDYVRVNIMRWCLRVKLTQNWNTFSKLLLDTGDNPIVEQSRKDDFWGAKVLDDRTLVGRNVLGRLLMELREAVKNNEKDSMLCVEPLTIPDFLLYGRPIQKIFTTTRIEQELETKQTERENEPIAMPSVPFQSSLFDPPPVKEDAATYLSANQAKTTLLNNLKPYSDYKESGSQWLGNVPMHWGVHNLRTLIRRRNERNRTDLPLLSVAREQGVFVRSLTDDKENHNVIPEDLSNYKVARAGNLVINKMKAWQGSMGIAPCDGIVSPAYFVYDFNITNRFFGQALLRSKPYVAHFAQASDGVRIGQWDLTIAGMRQIPVLVPSEEEQAAIVRFLNWANSRLGRAIKAKQKQIALLNEQKQAIIHRAITRGLDPSVPLKPSGIPWFGDIPKHWEVRRLKDLGTKFGSGVTPRGGASVYQDSGVPLLRSQNIHFGELRLNNVARISCQIHAAMSGTHVKPRDVLLNITGASIGRVCAVPENLEEANVNQHVCIIRPIHMLCDAEYLALFLATQAAQAAIYIAQNGSSREGLAVAKLKALPIVLSPLVEQRMIKKCIQHDTQGVRGAISLLEHEIELLREYRTRLVSDVVTGKIDVREVAAKLPDEEIEEAVEEHEDVESADEEIAV